MKKTTVSIVIPAYNEEKTIGFLLSDLQKQKVKKILIEQIVIVSDGSNDNTVSIAKSFEKNFKGLLTVIDSKKRVGLAGRQNELLGYGSKSEITVMLQSDIRIEDQLFLEIMVDQLKQFGADLVSCKIEEIKPVSFVEKVVWVGMQIKHEIFEHMNGGNNVYTCHGPARAFSQRLAKKLKFKESVGEDGFSYLYCIKNGFSYQYCFNTKVYYKLPDTLKDHQKQSERYLQSITIHEKVLGKEFTTKVYGGNSFLFGISPFVITSSLVKQFTQHPVLVTAYCIMQLYIRILAIRAKKIGKTWEVSQSSKVMKGVLKA